MKVRTIFQTIFKCEKATRRRSLLAVYPPAQGFVCRAGGGSSSAKRKVLMTDKMDKIPAGKARISF
jgi:hypothetical protein